MPREDAESLIEKHGATAHQRAVDQLVSALRGGDEPRAEHFAKVLKEIEFLREPRDRD